LYAEFISQATGSLSNYAQVPDDIIYAIAFSPDGKLKATGAGPGRWRHRKARKVVVDSPRDFEEWLRNEGGEARKPPADASETARRIREGQKVFFKQACINCHAA
jgi:mono/diheme cytochrome c family protein